MKTRMVLGMMSVALLAAGSLVAAEPGGPQGMECGRQPGGPGGGPMMRGGGVRGPMGHPPMGLDLERARKAGATEAQVQALADFQLEQQTRHIDLQAAADKADLKLGSLLQAKTPDEKAIMQAVDTVNAARAELFKLEVSSMLKAKQVLGEAVMKKLHEMAAPPPPAREPGTNGPRGGDRKPGDRDEDHGPAPDMK